MLVSLSCDSTRPALLAAAVIAAVAAAVWPHGAGPGDPGLHQHRRLLDGLSFRDRGGRAVRSQRLASRRPRSSRPARGGGLKLFCGGVGVAYPDIANASRRITPSEMALCAKNGVNDIVEVEIGYDGIVVANSQAAPRFNLTRARAVSGAGEDRARRCGKAIVAESLPDLVRKSTRSCPTSRSRYWGRLRPPVPAMRSSSWSWMCGCKTFPLIAAMSGADLQATCQALREDGASSRQARTTI